MENVIVSGGGGGQLDFVSGGNHKWLLWRVWQSEIFDGMGGDCFDFRAKTITDDCQSDEWRLV